MNKQTSNINLLQLITSTKDEIIRLVSSTKDDIMKVVIGTRQELLEVKQELIVTRENLTESIYTAIQESEMRVKQELRQEIKQAIKESEERLSAKIDTSQDEVIAVIQDVVQISSTAITDLRQRTTKLEHAVFPKLKSVA